MTDCECGSDRPPRLIKRARDNAGWPDGWNGVQVLECRDCGQRRTA
jgi:hypothetical protein